MQAGRPHKVTLSTLSAEPEKPDLLSTRCRPAGCPAPRWTPLAFPGHSALRLAPGLSPQVLPPHVHAHPHTHSNRYGFKWTLAESHPLTAPTPLTCQALGQLCRLHSRSAVSKRMPGVIPPPPCRPDLVVSPGKCSLNSPPSHCLLASPWTGCLPVTGAGPAGREGARWPGQSPRACSQALSF